jgi:hypothetical protein
MEQMLGHPVAPDLKVDHISRDPLDNRRENLRLATAGQNALNKRKMESAKSKYFGVGWVTAESRFRATIRIDGTTNYLGSYDAEEDAAKAYDIAVLQQPDSQFRPRNFPDRTEDQLRATVVLRDQKRLKKSKFRGVAWEESKFIAQISVNHKRLKLAQSDDEEKCAVAYDEYVVAHRLARPLNFPERHPDFVPDRPIRTEKEDVDEHTVRLLIRSAPSAAVLVDAEDYDRIKHYSCSIHVKGGVLIATGNAKKVWLNRYLMNESDPAVHVDHISGNKQDNRKVNLRLSNARQNGRNKRKRVGCTSQYQGVSITTKGAYKADVTNEDFTKKSKYFKVEEEAARWRDLYIKTTMPHAHFKFNFEWSDADVAIWRTKLGL